MGIGFGKSLKFGPLRVNLSRRGVGLSAGVKGARVAVGPRGTYVSLGAGGFRYRKKLAGSSRPRQPAGNAASSPPNSLPTEPSPGQPADLGAIVTATTAQLAEASPDSVLEEIQVRRHRINWFGAYAIVVGLSMITLLNAIDPILFVLMAIGPGFLVYRWNRERRTARLIYDVDEDQILYRLSVCNAVGEALAQAAHLWHVYASQAVSDKKRHSGASVLISRTRIKCHPGSLPGIELNIEPWSITVGPQRLIFLPDRILVHEGGQFAAIPYDQLAVQHERSRFIEEGAIPPDSKQVDTTWRFVNKSGGPDRRFNDNRELPIMEYGRLSMMSTGGLVVLLEASNPSASLRALNALTHLRDVTARSASAALDKCAPKGWPAESAAQPAAAQATDALEEVLTILRYIAVADRRLSEEESRFVAKALEEFSASPAQAQNMMVQFRSLKCDEREVRRACRGLIEKSPDLVQRVLAIAEALAGVDGRVTPKERERLAHLSLWFSAA